VTTKKIMDELAAELAKPKKQQSQKKLAALNKQLDQALGTELKDEPGDGRLLTMEDLKESWS
jgi:hypothetical protein